MLIPVESDMSACFAENDDILFAKLDILLEQSGEDDVAAVIALQKQKPECISDLMIRYAKHLRQRGCKYEDHYFSAKAMDYSIADKVTHAYCWSAKQSGLQSRLPEAIALLSENNESPERLAFVKKFIHSEIFIPDLLKSLKPRASNFSNRDSKRVCYILHNALPFASGGYATRAHGVATGLASKGYEVYAITRPGFPVDIKAEFAENYPAASEVLDGVTYLRSYEPIRSNNLLPQKLRPLAVSGANYITQAMHVYYRQFSQLRPSIVMAASNFITALPALLAARMLNIPFIYEVRGFWEVTRMSREPEYAKTSSYNLAVQMEAIVAQEAEHVFTLTEAMREELIRRGVSADRVQLLPNSTYPEKFHPRGRDKDLATKLAIPSEVPVIGYIGTFVDYEGLEDMAAACGLLKQRGYEFRLMVVGNENTSGTDQGPITTGIRQYAQDNGFEDWLIMPGRVPHDVVESYYSLIDIAPFPRKPVPVCEMVSPMKPLEAFAMEKAVVASDVRALEEMVLNNKTGLLFEKGNIKSFADTLEKLIVSPDLRQRLGKAGRQWVIENRDWRFIGDIIATNIAKVLVK
ncbi:glycosyltransferase family 4 protein [Rheinheimera baltica]|uniref:Glycosyltransferase family 4 protein n=2 Tax=Rheinheimera baltica TaxID=67576 RepID=A0ABT9I534_9GAMM|nr:glycosyltransferase family 4 protein [Rheinheimera baltica]MDP5138519.1 glycosyltransferase family 4 protein [Rheinheimera baltica]